VNVSFFAPFAVKKRLNRKGRKERKGFYTATYKKLKIELGKLKNTGGVLEQVFRHSSFLLCNVP